MGEGSRWKRRGGRWKIRIFLEILGIIGLIGSLGRGKLDWIDKIDRIETGMKSEE